MEIDPDVFRSKPGIYFFFNKASDFLYIGRAKYLPDRISYHFQNKRDQIQIKKILYIEIPDKNEREELEKILIRELQPRMNIKKYPLPTDYKGTILFEDIPAEFHCQFKAKCVMEQLTIKQALIEAMDMWIVKNPGKN